MLSKNKQKFILSLSRKKIREQNGMFVAEGTKLVTDLLQSSCNPKTLIATDDWLNHNQAVIGKTDELISATTEELKKVSTLKSPPSVIGIFEQKQVKYSIHSLSSQLCLLLDEVQDPGNLGTIVRLADWFGIEHVFCSLNCADIYNPKTIQSTMGAISRVNLHYVEPIKFLTAYKALNLPVYGTFLDGTNIYKQTLSNQGLIVMGNEGKGISKEVEDFVNQRLFIPSFPADIPTSESLNVSVATAITCAEFRRQAK
ncbi:RNA methyltransferase [Carboxylicivirga mesophila]|uniref:RNA methyltransferase n=1 Tax=Carboxylicivirga mesophila TaxID=1166478 RepID=A0ABS5KBX6_9BACT|nr:RNA methyltransferase [Carboxylicivirga mesophila]MBS2212041.1 RNA methyltransferase [Carboxylicivirga mesophila]